MKKIKLAIFERNKIRREWDYKKEKWYFSVVDIVAVLSESSDPRNYWKVLKGLLKEEGSEVVTKCNQLKFFTGKIYLENMSIFYKKAFTLIEIMVAILIIVVVSSLIIVSLNGTIDKFNVAKSQAFSDTLKTSILPDLISEWRFNGNANDFEGPNNGTATGATLITSGCVRDYCYNFDGSGDYLNMGSSATLNFTSDYTIEMFIYNGAGASSNPTLFNRAQQSVSNGYFWTYTGGTNEVNIYYQYAQGGTRATATFSNVFPKDKWTHLTFVFTNSSKALVFYRNGNYVSTSTLTSALPVDDGTLYFGTYNGSTSTSYTFLGKMDEIRWYKAAMPAYIIKEHYYSSLNNMIAEGSIEREEYMNLISGLNNVYGKN